MFTGKQVAEKFLKYEYPNLNEIINIDSANYKFEYIDEDAVVHTVKYSYNEVDECCYSNYTYSILEGKYSKIGNFAYSRLTSEYLRQICRKDPKLKEYWDTMLDIDLPLSSEFWSKIDLEYSKKNY